MLYVAQIKRKLFRYFKECSRFDYADRPAVSKGGSVYVKRNSYFKNGKLIPRNKRGFRTSAIAACRPATGLNYGDDARQTKTCLAGE